jgi:hypothetical protein
VQVSSSGNCGGGFWQCTTIDSSGDVGTYTSIALSNGTPYISYYDKSNTALKYAVEVGSGGNS